MDNKHHIVAITALIKNQDGDRFLIVKRGANEVAYPNKWALPGGKAEKGETILQTLRREVLEEVGLDIAEFKQYLKDYTFVRPDGQNVIGFSFLVKAKSENVKLSDDFQEFAWIKPEELSKYDHIEGMEAEVRAAF